MRFKTLKKKMKFYLAIGFIISLVIMLRIAIKEGNLVCGLFYKPAPCPFIPWLVQIIVFSIGVSIILALLFPAIKTVLKYLPEIKKLKKVIPKKKVEKIKEEERKIEKESKPEEKKEEIIKI